jgi:hypothetical protein
MKGPIENQRRNRRGRDGRVDVPTGDKVRENDKITNAGWLEKIIDGGLCGLHIVGV